LLSCYQIDLLSLAEKQRRALEAFLGGYISLGRLAEEMGLNVWETRKWLHEHEFSPNYSFLEDDTKNA
jgi:predicted HTH domain antitoxin